MLTEIRTFADGGDLAQDVETRHVRERARADAVQTPGEELPVDGVKRRMRNLHLDLARARGGDLDVRELEVGDGVRGVTLRAIRGGLPGFHGGHVYRRSGSRETRGVCEDTSKPKTLGKFGYRALSLE